MGKHNSARVEERRAEIFSRNKCKARAVVGRGEKSLLCDPGSELRLGGREKKGEDNKLDGENIHTRVFFPPEVIFHSRVLEPVL